MSPFYKFIINHNLCCCQTVDRRYVERPGNVCIDGTQDEVQLERLRAYAKAGKSGGSKIFVQLGHAGRQSNGMVRSDPLT
jgi:2,4-dienoyl-CoA reductase-like NADH-dependent reductase (Old Yellow Enzyme family)